MMHSQIFINAQYRHTELLSLGHLSFWVSPRGKQAVYCNAIQKQSFSAFISNEDNLELKMLELLQAGAKYSRIYIACPTNKLQQLTSLHIEKLHAIAIPVQTHLRTHHEATSPTHRRLQSTA
jgi:hypothetical protein